MNPIRSRQAVLLRSGGLGDFVLTLPLLHVLRETYERVTLVTRTSYRKLETCEAPASGCVDIDGPDVASLFASPSKRIRALLYGSDLFTFIGKDSGFFRRNLRKLKIGHACFLDSRPMTPPHIAVGMFRDAGLNMPEDLKERAWVGGAGGGADLWIHPGSGSPGKNMPLAFFRDRAVKELEDSAARVVISFGEADTDLIDPARRIFRDLPCRFVIRPSLSDLIHELRGAASCYLGNDSGVSHLAAALGVPTRVLFRTTLPEIWCPLGPDVTVLYGSDGEKGLPVGRQAGTD